MKLNDLCTIVGSIDMSLHHGEWLTEAIPSYFHNFGIFSYPNYKFAFALKALGFLARRYSVKRT